MLPDKRMMWMDDEAVTDDARSRVLDFGHDDAALAVSLPPTQRVVIQVTESFATLTSLTITVQESSDGTAWSTAHALPVTSRSNLTKGRLLLDRVVTFKRRYTRLNLNVNGSDATAGKLTAFPATESGYGSKDTSSGTSRGAGRETDRVTR